MDMDKINKIGYRIYFVITVIFVLAVCYGGYYIIKTDKERIEIKK